MIFNLMKPVPATESANSGTWELVDWSKPNNGEDIWTDGTNVYYSNNRTHYVLQGDTWVDKTWNGFMDFGILYPAIDSFYGAYGKGIWTDGTNIYYSYDEHQAVIQDDTWVKKTWNGTNDFCGYYVWTDGTNTYLSGRLSGKTYHYVLQGDTWASKSWGGTNYFTAKDIWTDGENFYISIGSSHYVLQGNTWVEKTWNGLTTFNADDIWTDGKNIYHGLDYVLNGDTWEPTTFVGSSDLEFERGFIWTNGGNVYFTRYSKTYILK